MFNKKIFFLNKLISNNKTSNKKIKKIFALLKLEYYNGKIPLLESCEKKYKLNYSKKIISEISKNKFINVIGMGGSVLGAKAIYSFLNRKVKKVFYFIDNLTENFYFRKNNASNIFISKSGNTLETITNLNFILKNKYNKNNNYFITEKKNNALHEIANRLKAEVIEHKNFIGGRYSVLSEVGMLPAQLMGLDVNKFKNLNFLINNKLFVTNLISNVSSLSNLIDKKKNNSIILNYDPDMNDFCFWYQQLIGESLGKKNKGLLPVISTVPKDNHSLLQFYLDGSKNSFFTIFFTKHFKKKKLNNSILPHDFKYLRNKNLETIINSQRLATQAIFLKKKIPFRTFYINEKNEEQLGALFTFFILETILLGKYMKINPFDQPAVESIKRSTKNILSKA